MSGKEHSPALLPQESAKRQDSEATTADLSDVSENLEELEAKQNLSGKCKLHVLINIQL